MLYDPKWAETKADPKPSLAGFVAWLARQDPSRRYNYIPACECAIGQYVKSEIGKTYIELCFQDGKMFEPQLKVFRAWNTLITSPEPHTFGAALARARELNAGHAEGAGD